jgi:PAS domain S-box-containing protein
VIGHAAFYFSLGFLLIFTQLVHATELKVVLGDPLVDFGIAQTVFFLPYLAALLIVYVTEGTLAAQRLIIGAMATLGFFAYLSHITAIQCNWVGYAISQGPSADSLDYLLRKSQWAMAGSTLAQTLDLFLIPIFFQRLRNLKCRMFIAVFGALCLTQLVDNFVYVSACFWGDPQWWFQLNSSSIAKVVLTAWLSFFATLYIERIEEDVPGEGRGTLDIVFAFFGGYSKAQALQQHVREWADRYRLVVENASDMILLLDEKGTILDANFAAMRILNITLRDAVIGKNFPSMMMNSKGERIEWNEYLSSFKIEDTSFGSHIQRLECMVKLPSQEKIELDIAISGIEGVGRQTLFIVMGRDVSERNRLNREQQQLREQLAHKQRLESIGQLAGGVAHDFNNYLHAIQGHLDLIDYMHDIEDEAVKRHLEKIGYVTEKAGLLTRQLLGFARKGTYVLKPLRIKDLLVQTIELFMPNNLANIDFVVDIREAGFVVKGDQVQLQQVFLNLLLNARDAFKDSLKREDFSPAIRLSLAPAADSDIIWSEPPDIKAPVNRADYFAVSVIDNGEGIPEENLNHIFEPFFTTKPFGEGTGMGLAMAYGAISNHKGWIHVESVPGEGTTFTVFLPILEMIPSH